jgi:hypothetical protein
MFFRPVATLIVFIFKELQKFLKKSKVKIKYKNLKSNKYQGIDLQFLNSIFRGQLLS